MIELIRIIGVYAGVVCVLFGTPALAQRSALAPFPRTSMAISFAAAEYSIFAPISTAQDSTASYPFLRPSLRYGIDTTVSPCADFDRYVNGLWRDSAVIPRGVPIYGAFYFVSIRTDQIIQHRLDSVARIASTTNDPVFRLVGQYFASCLSADSLERSLLALSMMGAARNDTMRAARCSRLMRKDIPDAISYVVTSTILPAQVEDRVRSMVNNIKQAADRRTSAVTWLDASAKARVHQGLEQMTLRVAKSASSMDYGSLNLSENDFNANRQKILSYLFTHQVSRTREQTEKMWKMNQLDPNAQYIRAVNTIEVPGLLFQWPFFNGTGEESMNYAAIGMFIGHEIYHGVTQYAQATADTVHAKRLVQQYSSMIVPGFGKINGLNTLDENLSDLGGLLAAYDAWSATGEPKKGAIVEGFSPEQRFFVHFARMWRWKVASHMVSVVMADSHAPNEARVNGVVKNVPAFAKAFGCREGDAMALSPNERVSIW